jgi:hypothetical protein
VSRALLDVKVVEFAAYAAGGASAVLAGWRENGGLDARE